MGPWNETCSTLLAGGGGQLNLPAGEGPDGADLGPEEGLMFCIPRRIAPQSTRSLANGWYAMILWRIPRLLNRQKWLFEG